MSVRMPAEAKDDLLYGALFCRHKAGSWNAVSADQFGEQTAIKIGKGDLKGITLSSTQVAERIDSFPISAYVSDTIGRCYAPDLSSSSSETPHKEEGDVKLMKMTASVLVQNLENDPTHSIPRVYNVHNGHVAPTIVNVSDSLAIGGTMVTAFQSSLPTGVHAKLSSPVLTMQHLKRGVKIGDKVVFDLESIFLRLLVVGQQREMELLPTFGYELCAVPASLMDENGCLRRGNKAILVHKLGVKHHVLIVDAEQLLCHVVWPCGGSVGELAESLKARFGLCAGHKLLPPCATQMLLWKASDQQGPPDISIAEHGWKIDDGITCPSIHSGT